MILSQEAIHNSKLVLVVFVNFRLLCGCRFVCNFGLQYHGLAKDNLRALCRPPADLKTPKDGLPREVQPNFKAEFTLPHTKNSKT